MPPCKRKLRYGMTLCKTHPREGFVLAERSCDHTRLDEVHQLTLRFLHLCRVIVFSLISQILMPRYCLCHNRLFFFLYFYLLRASMYLQMTRSYARSWTLIPLPRISWSGISISVNVVKDLTRSYQAAALWVGSFLPATFIVISLFRSTLLMQILFISDSVCCAR